MLFAASLSVVRAPIGRRIGAEANVSPRTWLRRQARFSYNGTQVTLRRVSPAGKEGVS